MSWRGEAPLAIAGEGHLLLMEVQAQTVGIPLGRSQNGDGGHHEAQMLTSDTLSRRSEVFRPRVLISVTAMGGRTNCGTAFSIIADGN